MTAGNDVPARLAEALDTIRAAFVAPDAEPWLVACSGGKDSLLAAVGLEPEAVPA